MNLSEEIKHDVYSVVRYEQSKKYSFMGQKE